MEFSASVTRFINVERLTRAESRAVGRAAADELCGELAAVSPALAKHESVTLNEVWSRPQLEARDRCIVTLSALITKSLFDELPLHINFALDNGLQARELSEIVTHLAFYAGFPNAKAATTMIKPIFLRRRISSRDLPPAEPRLLPLNVEDEDARSIYVNQQFASTAPGMVQYTTDLLFRNLWLRPDLQPRDRSLVTLSALIAGGHVAQIPFHLNRAMDNGLTQDEASEVLTHLAFEIGWPSVFAAMPIVKDVFEKRLS